MPELDKIVIVTRRTRLEEMITRYNTVAQARFCIERAGGDFSEYQVEHEVYQRALDRLRRDLDLGLKLHVIERALVPTYLFSQKDLVVTVGQDGLVANTARYVGSQPLVALNPDPDRFDGILLPFSCDVARRVVESVLQRRARHRAVTLAEVTLADGQRLTAFNDLFIGARTHVSARYRLRWDSSDEAQSSSGVLVSTGAGSTGWLSSVFQMARGVARFALGERSGWGLRLPCRRAVSHALGHPPAGLRGPRALCQPTLHGRRGGRPRRRAAGASPPSPSCRREE